MITHRVLGAYFTKVHFNFFKFVGPLPAKFYYRVDSSSRSLQLRSSNVDPFERLERNVWTRELNRTPPLAMARGTQY
jgi:hypothetical protein